MLLRALAGQEERVLKDCCVVHALVGLGLGVPVRLTSDGPFTITAGRDMIKLLGYDLVRVNYSVLRGLPVGKYVATYHAIGAPIGHGVGVIVSRTGFTMVDDGRISDYAGHLAWHRFLGGAECSAAKYWQLVGEPA